jgi:hypothetical protein
MGIKDNKDKRSIFNRWEDNDFEILSDDETEPIEEKSIKEKNTNKSKDTE